jgi:hypothetical protein
LSRNLLPTATLFHPITATANNDSPRIHYFGNCSGKPFYNQSHGVAMQASPESIQQAITLGQIITALLPLTVLVQVGIAIYAARRKPSISEELYREYATKKDLAELRCDFNKTISEYFARQHLNQSAIDDKFQAIMRSIGKVEGKLEKCPTICPPINRG